MTDKISEIKPAPKAEDNVNPALLKEVLADPKSFSKLILSKFDRIDTDGSGTLSLGELEQYGQRKDVDDKTKAAVSVLIDHFEDVRDLTRGTQATGNSPTDNLFRQYLPETNTGNTINREDLGVIDFASGTANVQAAMSGKRSSERWGGAAELATGLVVGAAGAAVEGAGIYLGGPWGGAAMATPAGVALYSAKVLVQDGSHEFSTGDLKYFEDAIVSRQKMLASWGFKVS